MKRLALLVLYLLVGTCSAQTSEEVFLQRYEAAFNASGIPYDETLIFEASSLESQGAVFDCESLPDSFIKTPAASVHALSPYHIKVMGAVGDSVTAGFGAKAKNIFQAMTEYRGVSWSIGGDDDLSSWVTLPNIIKKFNPNVKGFSVKTGKQTSSNSHFNRAVSGAISNDIPGQVRDLIDKIKADSSIKIDEDWKLITLWIGGNDLCGFCEDQGKYTAVNYVTNIKQGLDMLKDELPKTFVNLVQILDVSRLGKLHTGLLCDLVHAFACPCVSKSKYWDVTSEASRKYNEELEKMVENTPEYHNSDDFTVVLQPFFKDVELPTDANGDGDKSYFGLDCFHFSVKGHSEVAHALWNNMMNPVGVKEDHINWGKSSPLKCPTETFPYFFTHKNSKSLSLSSFGAVGPEPDSSNNDNPTNLLAILLGTGLTAFVITIAIVVVIVVVVYSRHRHRQRQSATVGLTVGMSVDTEKTRLIIKQ